MNEYDITAAFKVIEDELIASMIRNMDRHRAEEIREGYEWSMWQAEQLKALEKYKRNNQKKYKKQFQRINGEIEELIRKARQTGSMQQEIRILQAIRKGWKVHGKNQTPRPRSMTAEFFRLNDRKLEALIKATTHDMETAETAVLRKAEDDYRKAVYHAQVYANTGAGTYEQAVDMATRDMLSRGLNCIQYANGARHTLADYADMAIRTVSKRAYLQGEGEKRQEWGISTVIVNKRGNPCPKCLPFCGKVLIDDVWSGGPSDGVDPETGKKYPLMSKAIEFGLYHPRCKDAHTTYFPGISIADDSWTKEELDAIGQNYEREQKQQYARRQAEKYGRLSEYSLDKENQKRYATRREAWKQYAVRNAIVKISDDDIIKNIKIPHNVYAARNITSDIVDEIQSGIDEIMGEYDAKIDRILVEDISDRLPDTPYLVRFSNESGMKKVNFVINAGFDFDGFQEVVSAGYECGYFAGRTIKDHTIHEMAHVMTGQQYKTIAAFDDFAKRIEEKYVFGVSGYSDNAKDGFETIAEAFVRIRNNESVPDEAEKLVQKYIERWRNQ